MAITLGKNRLGLATPVDTNNLHSTNGVLRNTDMNPVSLESGYYRSYESGFIDLLNVHNVYLHCPNLGHFNSIGVRGESAIVKKHLYLHHSVIWLSIVLWRLMIKPMSHDN